MNTIRVEKFLAIAATVWLASLTFASRGAANDVEAVGRMGPVPKANCGPDDRTEGGLQGETTHQERLSGDSEHG